jgi:hypothetical protein
MDQPPRLRLATANSTVPVRPGRGLAPPDQLLQISRNPGIFTTCGHNAMAPGDVKAQVGQGTPNDARHCPHHGVFGPDAVNCVPVRGRLLLVTGGCAGSIAMAGRRSGPEGGSAR